ncbi:hypothetical protein ACFTS5_11115 [Nocardia sp. NPDC056952]|uniref:hypothetical protein n=1 Tax=Nocardia sp. NPDC056952 TaxID=3345979 RepID=UPI0036356360
MTITQWIFTLFVGLPASLLALRTFRFERPALGTNAEHRLLRRIDHEQKKIDGLEDNCPPETRLKKARLQRELAAIDHVVTEDSEDWLIARAALICLLPMAVITVIQLRSAPGSDQAWTAVALWWLVIVLIMPAVNVRTRLSARRSLYTRLGNRDDLPKIPEVSPWPLISRTPRRILIHKWMIEATSHAGNDISLVTNADIARINAAIAEWSANPWWKPMRRRLDAVLARLGQAINH